MVKRPTPIDGGQKPLGGTPDTDHDLAPEGTHETMHEAAPKPSEPVDAAPAKTAGAPAGGFAMAGPSPDPHPQDAHPQDAHPQDTHPESAAAEPKMSKPPGDAKTRIIEATMELAGERAFDDFGIPEIAARAGVSLVEFRDAFPSKGAVLGGFIRKLDRTVLEGTAKELADDAPKDRLFDVLMRRFDAMAPYRNGIEGVRDWARREPLAAAALNRELVNSMRFMLVAAGIDTEGSLGAFKTQALVISFGRMSDAWLRDDDPGLARTMAALDRELNRGEQIMGRAQDLHRMASPLRTLARALFDTNKVMQDRMREAMSGRRTRRPDETDYETGRGMRDVY